MDRRQLLDAVREVRDLAQRDRNVDEALKLILRARGRSFSEWVKADPEGVVVFAEQARGMIEDDGRADADKDRSSIERITYL
jgi:hypothetical protein